MIQTSDKDKILKEGREKGHCIHRIEKRITDYSLLQTQVRWQQYNFNVLKGKNYQPRMITPVEISFKTENKINAFTGIQRAERICNHDFCAT